MILKKGGFFMKYDKVSHLRTEGNTVEETKRLEELENLVEKHTRTERHLEQHSDIASSNRVHEAKEKQEKREDSIEALEEKIINGDQIHHDESEGLEKNYIFAKGYMEHNCQHMDPEALENMKEKQQNRRDKMEELT
jgi:hypothetical protein